MAICHALATLVLQLEKYDAILKDEDADGP
jgi:hypothetical protein